MPRLPHRLHRQRGGLVILLMLVLAGTAFSAHLLSSLSRGVLDRQKEQKTHDALLRAKAALLAWSASQGGLAGNTRPGELPCPTINLPLDGDQAGTCSPGTIGRLPWRTLGIEELKDADGEALWYAVDGAFRRRWGMASSTNQPINSDTTASLQVYGKDGTTLLTPAGEEAAAIIFAAGAPLAGQDGRPSPSRADYLEAALGRSNQATGGPFIAGPVNDDSGNLLVNDRLVIVTAREVLRAAEIRVLGEARKMLKDYAGAHLGRVPNPASPGDAICLSVPDPQAPVPCPADPTRCRGRFPEDAAPAGAPWTYLPSWFEQNGWGRVLAYSVQQSRLQTAAGGCGPQTVAGDPATYQAVLVASGSRRPAQVRPSAALANYLEDATNQDTWTASAPAGDQFMPPSLGNDFLQKLTLP